MQIMYGIQMKQKFKLVNNLEQGQLGENQMQFITPSPSEVTRLVGR
jgi:hypothetical protein